MFTKMLNKHLKVVHVNAKTNFCYLGFNVLNRDTSNVVVEVNCGSDRTMYFAVGSSPLNIGNECIGINSLYAKLLGIDDEESVTVTEFKPITKVKSFVINPVKLDDYHVLDILKDEVEKCVLQQTKVVHENQEFIIWITGNLSIPVKVARVQPSSPGLLAEFTELVVLPKSIENSVEANEQNGANLKNVGDEIAEVEKQLEIFEFSCNLSKNEVDKEMKLNAYKNKNEYHRGRLVPFKCLESSELSKWFYEFNTFISKSNAPITWRKKDSFKDPIVCSLETSSSTDCRTVYVRVFLVEDAIFNEVGLVKTNFYVHSSLFTLLNCSIGCGAILRIINGYQLVEEIIIHRKSKKENLKDLLKEYLAEICKIQEFILNPRVSIKLNDDTCCSLEFKPFTQYCWVNEDFLRSCKYRIVEDPAVTSPPFGIQKKTTRFIETKCHQSICDEIIQNVKDSLVRNDKFCCLITGSIGEGKTAIVKHIRDLLWESPFFIYTEILKSRNLKGKTVEALHKTVTTLLETLVKHQPSILIIEDLNVICDNIANSDAQAQNALYYNRISEMLHSLLTTVISHTSVGIIATAESTTKLNKHIYSSRGSHLFDDVYQIGELTKEDRRFVIEKLFKEFSTDIDFEILCLKTNGFVFQDLIDFSRKSIFQAMKEDRDSKTIRQSHCDEALSQITILSLNDVKLHSPGDKDFSDVGGLPEIKKILSESLLWPLKYPKIFGNAPLRPQSGLLLYGPPGTGKTLLAAAAAKQCGTRLISIKGPELLSKYIGASEQAVRDVFLQAQNAKPCILFFDEFDSLAPRRGHDITGVTDRVVNQLLTQMDGVESLVGVCVLAATSRPDLLDPALLRPGRLDQQILCPLPDLEDRLDILKVLSKNLNFSNNVDLSLIAASTDGYSGADLQSLLYNAQLSTLEHLLSSEDKDDDDERKPITQEILNESLLKTKPSLTERERKKYDYIYSKFQGKDLSYLKPGSKASLA